ncbi:MAG: hypothetical protein MAG431_00738 [Chloroflexi bacterium]|nr:hypothetical protein [Chloroflexota bacterium]
MEEQEPELQVQMVWPANLLSAPPTYQVPTGYRLRAYQPGDEPRFYQLMELAGWPGWDDAKLKPWLHRILPEGWVMAVSERFLSAGYRTIHLYTEPWRLAALKIYLKLGYVPLIADPGDLDHWQKICQEVDFPFSLAKE